MFFTAARGLLAHAFPILIAQLSSIGMMVVDTAVLGHVSPLELAAVAIGGGIHVSVVFALVGILQAVAPVVAHLHGAKRDDEVAGVLQQGFWLALLLTVPGVLFLTHPGAVLGIVEMDAAVDAKVRQYLGLLAWGLPAALCYRTFYAFCNALGKPRVLMGIGLFSLALHAVLAWGLALQGWLGEPLGVVGCAISNIVIGWLACLSGAAYLAWGPLGRRYRPFSGWQWPRWTMWLPLSLAIATMAAVGQAVGGRERLRAHATIKAGLILAAGLSTLAGLLLWFATAPLVAAYTDDPAVRAIATSLVIYVAIYQFFDALQTVAGHALRAYRVTFVPMLVQTFCFWGVGLLGGAWLCYRWQPALGVAGFWLAAVIGLVLAAALLLPLLYQAVKASESSS